MYFVHFYQLIVALCKLKYWFYYCKCCISLKIPFFREAVLELMIMICLLLRRDEAVDNDGSLILLIMDIKFQYSKQGSLLPFNSISFIFGELSRWIQVMKNQVCC